MAKEPKEHVKKHLEKRHIDPATTLGRRDRRAERFSTEELDKVDDLGAALMGDAEPDRDQKISAVH